MPPHSLNRIPEVTIAFWVIKILSATVGETAADYLNVNLNLGLANTTYLMSVLLVVALVAHQHRTRTRPNQEQDWQPAIPRTDHA